MDILKYLNEENLDHFLKNFDFETLDIGEEKLLRIIVKIMDMLKR